jgi:hypothetical protein
MKNLILILLLTGLTKPAWAQKDKLTTDEHDKYIYYQAADMPGLTADTLYNRCLSGLTQYYHGTGFSPVGKERTTIDIQPTLIVYSNKSLAKHEEGEIAYTLHLEFKNAKYRYWLNDFIFRPYQRNRYSEFEKVPGVEVPLEKVKSKYGDNALANYQEQIVAFAKQIGENLKIYMANLQKESVPAEKVNTKNW